MFLTYVDKLGMSSKTPQSFIAQPDLVRSKDKDVDKYLKICEAVMIISDKAVLSTVATISECENKNHVSTPMA